MFLSSISFTEYYISQNFIYLESCFISRPLLFNPETNRAWTTKELLAILQEDSDEESSPKKCLDAVYIPPEVDTLTDDERLDENVIGEEPLETDIAGTFEIHKNNDSPSISNDANDEIPAKRPKQSTEICLQPKWTKPDSVNFSESPNFEEQTCRENIIRLYGGKSPIEMFNYFCDDNLLNTVISFSQLYALSKNAHDVEISIKLLKRFIGILILSGYHTLPQCDLYWSNDDDKGVSVVKNSMSRNCFRQLKRYLHLSDNNQLDKSDKFSKLRPVIEILNKNFLKIGFFSNNISIDEQMVPYFGRHSAKMFIKGKPVRFGFKIWCMCSAGGYMFQFQPYGGKSEKTRPLGLGAQVVLDFVNLIPDPKKHLIFFDNFFSSYSLLQELKKIGCFATGTIRDNRTAKCPIENVKHIAKQARGTYEYAYDENNEICVVRWNDNSVVTVASNSFGPEPIKKAKRYNRKKKQEEVVPQPNIVYQYNKFMGGVDLHDNGVANYRIKIRGKKWWWPLFINMIDSAAVNAWKIHNIANESNMPLLDFKSYIARSLLQFESVEPIARSINDQPRRGRPAVNSVLDEVRKDKVGHLIVRDETRQRCRVCKSQTIYRCERCNVKLHPDCFKAYHE